MDQWFGLTMANEAEKDGRIPARPRLSAFVGGHLCYHSTYRMESVLVGGTYGIDPAPLPFPVSFLSTLSALNGQFRSPASRHWSRPRAVLLHCFIPSSSPSSLGFSSVFDIAILLWVLLSRVPGALNLWRSYVT